MTNRRSVRHLIKGLGPGGAERLLLNQVRAEQGRVTHDVTYLVEEKSHLVPELAELGATVTRLPSRGARWILGLRRLLRDQPTEIVHVHSPLLAAVTRVLARTVPRSNRPAIVGTEHNRWPRHHRATRLANRVTIRLEAATIAVSTDVAATIQGARPGQVRVIEHGIDLESVRARADRSGARAEFGAADADIVVICVANLRREKALDDLIGAARTALTQVPELRFVLVGQGPLADEVDRWIEAAGITDRFTALGYRTDVARLLSGAEIFTLSSHHEGLPVALMEALAVGLPVAATRAGGIPDAVGDAGRLVPVGDRSGLAEAFVDLARQPAERERLSAAAAERSRWFSVDRAVGEIGAVYDDVTSDSVGAGSGDNSGPSSES